MQNSQFSGSDEAAYCRAASLYDSPIACYECGDAYSEKNYKVRHHDHVSGDYIGPLCRNCNLQVKPRQALIAKNHFAERVKLNDGTEVRDVEEEEKRYHIQIGRASCRERV